MTFEEGYERLEALTKALETGEMPLEDSFAAFEEGAKLLETLTKMLDAGEKRVMELTGEGEKPLSGEAV